MATVHGVAGLGVRQAIQRKAFPGNKRALGHPHIVKSTGAPTSAAKVGTLCWDVTNSEAYICTVASGTWVKINA